MSQFIQLLNGYGLIWLPVIAAFATLAILAIRRSRVRWWALWMMSVAGVGVSLSLLQTASGTEITRTNADEDDTQAHLTYQDIEWQSANSIENALRASKGKPTLVEFYTDYGIG